MCAATRKRGVDINGQRITRVAFARSFFCLPKREKCENKGDVWDCSECCEGTECVANHSWKKKEEEAEGEPIEKWTCRAPKREPAEPEPEPAPDPVEPNPAPAPGPDSNGHCTESGWVSDCDQCYSAGCGCYLTMHEGSAKAFCLSDSEVSFPKQAIKPSSFLRTN